MVDYHFSLCRAMALKQTEENEEEISDKLLNEVRENSEDIKKNMKNMKENFSILLSRLRN